MKIKNILIIITIISNLSAVGEAGAIFLLIAPGAGAQGLGEAQVAKADDAYASYYNPAGLGFLKGTEVAGMHVNWLPNLASDLYYEFITYRHHIDGLGSLGGHVIYLNLGEQVGMDEFGNPTDNWKSYMGAVAGSFGTKLSETSSIGFNFKVFHQKLSDQVTAGEEGKGFSTDFGFDIGYLKKIKKSSSKLKNKRVKQLYKYFEQLSDIQDRQKKLNDSYESIFQDELDGVDYVEEQRYVLEDINSIISNFDKYSNLSNHENLNSIFNSVTKKMSELIEKFDNIYDQELMPHLVEGFQDSTSYLVDSIELQLLDVESNRELLIEDIESEVLVDLDDRFNFGFSISNIGPKIDFVDVDQADPSPTNMRLGIFAQLYNDGHNKVNFLFDANKLLVTRYQMMDWDDDGYVGGYDQYGSWVSENDPLAIYNESGKKEYDNKGYFDDPWYLAIATAWLDDWFFGGDIDYDGDRKIGGWAWTVEDDINGDLEPNIDELKEDPSGEYGKCVNDEVCLEKGTGETRSFTQELNEMVYNVGLEYWYTDAFALRAGYIHDSEGNIFNPTVGAGIRLLQYGFDFGYTAGEQGHPRANTMFFSINIKL